MWIVHSQSKMWGPYSTDEVRQGLREGRFKGHDLVWRKGFESWVVLVRQPEFHPHNWSLTTEGERTLSDVVEMPVANSSPDFAGTDLTRDLVPPAKSPRGGAKRIPN